MASAWEFTGDARLDFLIRLFYLGEAVTISQSEKFIPKEILRVLCTSGLLELDGERVRPACMLTHFGELLLACDSSEKKAPLDRVIPEGLRVIEKLAVSGLILL